MSKIQKQNCPHGDTRMLQYDPPLCVRFTDATIHSRPGSRNTRSASHFRRYLSACTHADLSSVVSPAGKNHQSSSIQRVCRGPRGEILAQQDRTRSDVPLYTLRLSARQYFTSWAAKYTLKAKGLMSFSCRAAHRRQICMGASGQVPPGISCTVGVSGPRSAMDGGIGESHA